MIKKLFVLATVTAFLFGVFGVVIAEPIKVGLPYPMTGYYAPDGIGAKQGLEMAVDEINKAGGLLGRPLEIISFDIQDFAPERLMQAADKLVGKDKADAIHAGWVGWGQDVRAFGKYDVPFWVNDASINAVEVFKEDPKKYSNFFMSCDVEKAIGADMYDVMNQLPYAYPNKKIVLVVADDDWGRRVGDAMEERAKETGWEVAMYEVVPYGTREWGPILTKIKAIKPAWMQVEVPSPPDVITFIEQFKKAPTNSLINVGYTMYQRGFIENLGDKGNGIMGENIGLGYPVGPTPESNAWMQKYTDTYEMIPQASAFIVYTTAMIWADAVKKVGDVENYKAIAEHVAKTPYKSLDGYTLWFDDDHKIPLESWPVNHTQIQDGQFVVAYTGPGKKYLNYEFQVPPWIKK
jgi:branched-chain amino acid transport system substrate-binding protein